MAVAGKCVPALVLFLGLVLVACQTSPQPSPAIATNTAPQPSGVVELVQVNMLAIACQPLRVEARVAGVVTDKFRVTYVCVTCAGRFPPPSPGYVAPETTAQFDRIAADRFQADITFPRGGTWRVQTSEVSVPNPRPSVQVIDVAASACGG
jgi:hypothetical protein